MAESGNKPRRARQRKDERPDPRRLREDVFSKQEVEEPQEALLLYGRNPVKEAIKSGRSIQKVYVVEREKQDGSLREILGLARDRKLVVTELSRDKLNSLTAPHAPEGERAVHQGIAALLSAVEYVEPEEILQAARDRGETPFVLVLDSIVDPHNLGAILRTAEAAGVHGVIIPKRRAAGVNGTVAKASAGAVFYSRIAQVGNLVQCVENLKKAGLWIAGADMAGESMYNAPLDGPLALVIGGEGEGIAPLLKKNCDFMVSVPMCGEINSLNASASAAILIYEKLRRDRIGDHGA